MSFLITPHRPALNPVCLNIETLNGTKFSTIMNSNRLTNIKSQIIDIGSLTQLHSFKILLIFKILILEADLLFFIEWLARSIYLTNLFVFNREMLDIVSKTNLL